MPNVVFSLTRLTIPVHNTMGLVHTRLIRACHKQLIAERALPVLKSADPTANQLSRSPRETPPKSSYNVLTSSSGQEGLGPFIYISYNKFPY